MNRTFIFFVYLSGDHQTLHSFPTRRSSDLTLEESRGRHGPHVGHVQHLPGREPGQCLSPSGHISCHLVDEGQEDRLRSEEHTSELQSQSNLVCRLLLEKTKAHGVCNCVSD